jgi:hypothetical protein
LLPGIDLHQLKNRRRMSSDKNDLDEKLRFNAVVEVLVTLLILAAALLILNAL